MGYNQYTVSNTVAVEPTFAASLKTLGENHPQYLLGLLCALFPTTFFEIAVYITHSSKCIWSYGVALFHFYDLLGLNCQHISFGVNSLENNANQIKRGGQTH